MLNQWSQSTEGIEGFKWGTNMCVCLCACVCVWGVYCLDIVCELYHIWGQDFDLSHLTEGCLAREKMVFLLSVLIRFVGNLHATLKKLISWCR